jgi:hypothetical protein
LAVLPHDNCKANLLFGMIIVRRRLKGKNSLPKLAPAFDESFNIGMEHSCRFQQIWGQIAFAPLFSGVVGQR